MILGIWLKINDWKKSDDLNDKVSTAVSAVSGGVWSRREGIMFAGNADRIDEELKEIEEEQTAKNEGVRKMEQKNAP